MWCQQRSLPGSYNNIYFVLRYNIAIIDNIDSGPSIIINVHSQPTQICPFTKWFRVQKQGQSHENQ